MSVGGARMVEVSETPGHPDSHAVAREPVGFVYRRVYMRPINDSVII